MRPRGQTVALLEVGLATIAVEAMRGHYVPTVDVWIENLETRAWRLYLAGGRLAFARGRMAVDQILLARPTPTAGSSVL